MVPKRKPRLGITIGDPAGIGPEVALMAMIECHCSADYVLFGPELVWQFIGARLADKRADLRPGIADALGSAEIVETAEPADQDYVTPGATDARCGRIAIGAIRGAVQSARAGGIDAVVTAPLSKEGLHLAGASWPGHTEMLRDLCGVEETTMAFVGGGLVMALATIHVPLRNVFNLLTPDLILRKARHLRDFSNSLGIEAPRIGVPGLNPHASEGGLFGNEEALVIEPAIARARDEGLDLHGPFPPDTIFHEALEGRLDAVLALYHDQGLIALKTLAFDSSVNVTLGLPIVRTSPDHGTAFSIAGSGTARPGSMISAARLASRLVHQRSVTGA